MEINATKYNTCATDKEKCAGMLKVVFAYGQLVQRGPNPCSFE